MSQFFIDEQVAPPPLPPTVPTSFVTDSGTAVPAANVINVVTPGGGTEGISTSGSGNTITITLAGTTDFTTTTTGPSTSLLPLQTVPQDKAAIVKVTSVGYDATAGLMTSLYSIAGVRNVGGAITIVDNSPASNNDTKVREDGGLSDTNIHFTTGVGGYIVNVIGTNNGGGAEVINWSIKIEQLNSP